MKNTPKTAFTAVILAADRGSDDPVAMAAGARCKSMVPVGGTPMVLRVLDALGASREIDTRILCGPAKPILDREDQLQARIASGEVKWVANQSTPSTSTYHVLQALPQQTPVLVTTADHALLSPDIVDYFCSNARATGCDVVVGLASHEHVLKAFPNTRRTVTRLRDGAFCGCNLFAFLNPRARVAADFWRRVESQRKKPLRVISALGWTAILRYFLGRLSLAEGLDRISQRLDIRAGALILPFPEAAVDVDTVSDWKLVESILSDCTP